jgi:hypothetical protein
LAAWNYAYLSSGKTNPIMRTIYKQTLLSFLLVLSACLLHDAQAQNSKQVKKFTKDVEMQGTKPVKVELNQSAGILQVSGGSSKLMEGQFAFSKDEWKPLVAYTKEDGKLLVKQPGNNRNINMEDKDTNEWKVKLTNNVPVDLELTVGAGQSTMDLRGMKLTNLLLKAGAGDFTLNLANTSLPALEINAGVGAMKLDLSGKWANNLKADIDGGIGEMSLKLPANTGVRVKISGLGSIEAPGFRKESGYYVNDAYHKTDHLLTIDISGGLGSVNLELVK